MGLVIHLEKTVKLSDIWCSREDWDEYKNKQDLIDLLVEEDWTSMIEECGGLKEIIKSFWWED